MHQSMIIRGDFRRHNKWIGKTLFINISMKYEMLWKCCHVITLIIIATSLFSTCGPKNTLICQLETMNWYIVSNGKTHFCPCLHTYCKIIYQNILYDAYTPTNAGLKTIPVGLKMNKLTGWVVLTQRLGYWVVLTQWLCGFNPANGLIKPVIGWF